MPSAMSDPFPVAPAPFRGDSRHVDPGASFDWLRQGWAVFLDDPILWLAVAAVSLIGMLVVALVPGVGSLAIHLFLPIVVAGWLQLCRRRAVGDQPTFADLFIGFKRRSSDLLLVGVFYVVGLALVGAVTAGIGASGFFAGFALGRLAGLGVAFGALLLSGLLAIVLFVPVIMAVWFAPALVFFHHMPALAAMKASFGAVARNWLAMLVYALILAVLAFFAVLPMGLGFLVLLPVFAGTLYASYRDVFPAT